MNKRNKAARSALGELKDAAKLVLEFSIENMAMPKNHEENACISDLHARYRTSV